MRLLILLLLLLPFSALAGSPTLPDLSKAPAGLVRDGAADVALIVAVEDYAFLPDVPGARANALAWESYLRARGVGTVKVLLDRNATRLEMLDAATALAAMRGGSGKAWLVFIGHGAPGKDDHGALVAMDAQQTAGSLQAYSVGQKELIGALGANDGAPVVAVIDACFSGATAAGALAPGSMPVRPVEVLVPDRSTVLLAAGSSEYAGDLPGTGRPAFSWLVLGGLRGWADLDDSGEVTGAEVESWTRRQLIEVVNGRQQTPRTEGVRELILARGREAAPDLVALVRGAPSAPRGATAAVVSDDALLGDVAAITAKLKEAESLKKQLGEARERELSAAVVRAQAQAKDTWGKLAPLRELGGPDAEAKVRAYIAKYRSLDAEYADAEGQWTRAVEVPEVDAAEAWLRRPVQSEATVDTRHSRPAARGGRTGLWVVDSLLLGGGAAALVVGQLGAASLEQDVVDGTLTRPDAEARQGTVNLLTGVGYGGLVAAGGRGVGLVVVHPTAGGARIGVVGWF